jgi:hypothetical protein
MLPGCTLSPAWPACAWLLSIASQHT